MKSLISERQRQVLELVMQALPNKEIAYRLDMSAYTVKQCLYLMFARLNVHSRMEAADWARRHPELMRAPAGPEVYQYPIGV